MAEYRFDFKEGVTNVVKNGNFANAYSFTAAEWEQIPYSVSGRREILFLSERYTLQQISGTPADREFARGAYCEEYVTNVNGAVAWSGLWMRQTGILEIGIGYTVQFRVRAFSPGGGGSEQVEIRLGSTGTVLNVNSNGLYSFPGVPAGDTTLYINWFDCKCLIEFVKIEKQTAPTFQTVSNPTNVTDLTKLAERSDLLLGVFERLNQEVVFDSTAYDFLKAVRDDQGNNAYTEVEIYSRCSNLDAWDLFFNGRIYFDKAIFNESTCQVEVMIEPNDAAGQIIRNLDAPFNMWDNNTIDGLYAQKMTLVNSGGGLVTFQSSTGNKTLRNAWYFHDLVAKAISFATNDEASIDAPDLGGSAQGYPSDGQFSQMIVTTGAELRTVTEISAYTTPREVLEACRNNFGLYGKIDTSGGTPIVVFAPISGIYDNANTSESFTYLPDLTLEIDDTIRYKSINLGFQEFDSDGSTLGTADEPFAILGVTFDSNNSGGSSLDYVTNIIASSNIIDTKLQETTAATSVLEYDKSIFFSELQAHTTYTTKIIPTTGPFNVAVAVPQNNESIYPWLSYRRISVLINQSGHFGRWNGAFTNGLLATGHYLDFYDTADIAPEFCTWIKPVSEIALERVATFSVPLTETQLRNIIDNQEYRVGFSTDGSVSTYGWIKTIEIDLDSSIARIELITE